MSGPRVVRRDDERSVGAQRDRCLGELEGFVELRRSRAREERHPVGDLVGDDLHRGDSFGHGLRTRLAGGTAERDPVRARRELPPHQPPKAVVVHLPVSGEWSHHRSDGPPDRRGVRTGTSWRRLDDRCLIGHLVADVLQERTRGLEAMTPGECLDLVGDRPASMSCSNRSCSATLPIARSGMNSNADLRVVSISSHSFTTMVSRCRFGQRR